MHTIQIDASPHQIRKLRKGHRVRVKKGTGFELLVHPQTYNIVSRSFNKGKGSQIQLSEAEIEANRGIDKAISPEAHKIPQLNSTTAPKALQPSGPALIPSPQLPTAPTGPVTGTGVHHQLYNELNHHLGTNYGYLARAGMDNLMNSNHSAVMAKHGIDARYAQSPSIGSMNNIGGPPSRLIGGSIPEKGSIGRKGGLLHAFTPPALISQPFSANFQFQHFLPPQYQHFNAGGALDIDGFGGIGGNGLYV
jgi:hypothetical protein